MKHIYKEGTDKTKPVLLLLHGTGGDELSLLSLAKAIDPLASILSVKGQEEEQGMSRFFKRFGEGLFDEENLILRTKELNDFIDEASKKYNFYRGNVVAIGYSNGANIAAALLLLHENSLKGAILHHPTVPLRTKEVKQLKDVPIFIGAGTNDNICKPDGTKELESILRSSGAKVEVHWENHGHSLTSTEVQAAAKFYEESKIPSIL